MLAIPNTTTTASDTATGAAVFPAGGDAGALTPYASGFFFVANNAAQISIRKGPTSGQAQWTPYTLVSPAMVPLSTDRGGRHLPDFIYGVKAIDGVAGTHAQVFGALFQAGEAGFVPSAQFAGTVSAAGGFTPPAPSSGMNLFSHQTLSAPQAAMTVQGITQGGIGLVIHFHGGSAGAVDDENLQLRFNNDATVNYLAETLDANGAAAGAVASGAANSLRVGNLPGTTAPRQSGGVIIDVPFYQLAGNTPVLSRSVIQTGFSLLELNGGHWGGGLVNRVDLFTASGANLVIGSELALWVIS